MPSGCRSCGYSIKGLPGPNCPECNASIAFPGLATRDPDRLAAIVFLCLMLLTFGRTLARAFHWLVIMSSPDHKADPFDALPFFFMGMLMLCHALLFWLMISAVRRERARRGWDILGKATVLTLAAACIFLRFDPFGLP